MWKYTVEVRGMMCAMCESHVNDAVRRALRVKSVRSSRAKNETVVLAEQALDEAALRDAIAATGYEVGGVTRQQAQKGLFGWVCGRAMALPYKPGRTSRSTGKPGSRVITNLCRGRCLHCARRRVSEANRAARPGS